jgi:PKD repeat protein
MKKIFTKQFLLMFVSIVVLLVVAFFACKKVEESINPTKKSNSLMQYYDSKLVESFKKESIAQEFLREVGRTPISIVNNILSFESIEDFNLVYDLLVDFTDRLDELTSNNVSYTKYVESEQMPNNVLSLLFESSLGFYSLREEIETQIVQMERGDGMLDDSDPDDHYTVSPYLRTFLTPQCEVIIDDLICVFYDTYSIGIMNYDWTTLNELHLFQGRTYNDEKKALEHCAGKPNAFFITTGSEPTLHVDFIYNVNSENLQVQFINYSYSEDYKNLEYLWDFGDGTTSTEKNPIHTYASLEVEYPVSLAVNLNNNRAPASGTVGSMIMLDAGDPKTVFITYSEGNNGKVSFTINNIGMSEVFLCSWDFGDGSPTQQFGSSAFASHTYSNNGNYNVILTIHLNDMTTITVEKTIQVTKLSGGGGGGGGGGGTSCCVKDMDREVEKNGKTYTQDNENRRVKQVIRATNIFGFHRIAATTKIQYKNSNGKWKARKVEKISVGAVGTIYWVNNNCGNCKCPASVDLWKGGNSHDDGVKKNASKVVMDHGVGLKFTVGSKTLYSRHYVFDGVERMKGTGLAAVHDKNCN